MAEFLDTIRFLILVKNIVGSIREKTQEHTLSLVGLEFGITITRGATPNATAKVLQILKVITTAKSSFKTRRIHTDTEFCIEETKGMIKAIRSKQMSILAPISWARILLATVRWVRSTKPS